MNIYDEDYDDCDEGYCEGCDYYEEGCPCLVCEIELLAQGEEF